MDQQQEQAAPKPQRQHDTIIPNPDTSKDIKGNVTFGKGCIVNPGCLIIADKDAGPIVFGDYNIIEERCVIHNKPQKDGSVKTMNIGSYNLFEVDAKINSSNIGDYNTFEHQCQVDRNCEIPSTCTIGAAVKLPTTTKLMNKTKVYWPDKLVQDLNFEEELFKNDRVSMYEALATQLSKHPKSIKKIQPQQQ